MSVETASVRISLLRSWQSLIERPRIVPRKVSCRQTTLFQAITNEAGALPASQVVVAGIRRALRSTIEHTSILVGCGLDCLALFVFLNVRLDLAGTAKRISCWIEARCAYLCSHPISDVTESPCSVGEIAHVHIESERVDVGQRIVQYICICV